MAACTFFGHNETPQEAETVLREVIIDLIENNNANMSYVGNQGKFDGMARRTLKSLKADYPDIDYAVVLAYMPIEKDESDYRDYSDTIFPDGLENVHPRFAIAKRNRWMIDMADYVVTYVSHGWGGAARFKELAEKKGKTVINLPDRINRDKAISSG